MPQAVGMFLLVQLGFELQEQKMVGELNINYMKAFQKKPMASQRELAEDLGFSLGKLNYCLKALQKKGLVKLQNFQKVN